MKTQDVLFDIPFAPRINSRWRESHDRHLAWARRMGLVRTDDGLERYAGWRPADVAAMWFPDAEDADLDLGSDIFGWFLLFDEQFDADRGNQPGTVHAAISEISKVLRDEGGPHASPAATSLADIWNRERQGMSAAWQRRAARNWQDYLATYVLEAANREQSAELSVDAYMKLRDKSGVMYVLLDLVERIGRFEVPDAVADSPPVRTAYLMTVQVVNIVNDMHSLGKEEKRGDLHNLILVLEREQGCSRAEAIRLTREMVRGWTDNFLRAEAALPAACDEFGISLSDRTAGYRLMEGMRAAMRGNHDWCASTVRYSPDDVPSPDRPAYIEDIL